VSSLRTLAGVVQSVKADSARAGLAGHVWQTYLGNEAFMSSAPCGDVCGLVSAAAFALSKEQCDATTARIEKRFASDEAASQGLSPAEATLVAQALDALKASR
jgi:hypothetical protein